MKPKKRKQLDLRKLLLELLFKEVLENVRPEEADALTKAYADGKSIILYMGCFEYGQDKKTAFRFGITGDNWRTKPTKLSVDPDPTIQ
jgi:hypothetical protein